MEKPSSEAAIRIAWFCLAGETEALHLFDLHCREEETYSIPSVGIMQAETAVRSGARRMICELEKQYRLGELHPNGAVFLVRC